jgi:hypothetical protein
MFAVLPTAARFYARPVIGHARREQSRPGEACHAATGIRITRGRAVPSPPLLLIHRVRAGSATRPRQSIRLHAAQTPAGL